MKLLCKKNPRELLWKTLLVALWPRSCSMQSPISRGIGNNQELKTFFQPDFPTKPTLYACALTPVSTTASIRRQKNHVISMWDVNIGAFSLQVSVTCAGNHVGSTRRRKKGKNAGIPNFVRNMIVGMDILCQSIKKSLMVVFSSTKAIDLKCALMLTAKDASVVAFFLLEITRT